MANRVEIDTELNADGVVRSVDEIEKEIDKVIKAQERLQAKFDKFREMNPNDNSSKTFRSMQYDAAQLEIRLEELNAELERANSNNMQISLDGLSESAKRTGGLLTNLGSKLKSFVKTMGTNLVQSVKKGTRALLDFLNPLKKTNNSLKSGITTLLKYGFGIRSLFVLVNKLRSALVEGMKNLAQFNDGINPTNTALSNLKSSLTQLKNSFASAFAPILTVIEPIITKMINLLSKAATAVGMFFAALTGQKTFIKATAVQENYAKSLEKTSKAAKKAKTYLSGLDEVRQYTPAEESEKTSADAGVGNMFEEVPIDSKFADMAKKLKDYLNKIKDLIKNNKFEELGFMLAEDLANALDKIPWEKIQSKCVDIANKFARFLNGVFSNKHLFTSLGHTIAEALNTVILTALEFVTTFDWREAGNSIGVGLNQMISDIKWAELGQLIGESFKGVLGFLVELIETFDWYQFGQSIGVMLANIDWAGCISLMFEAIGAVLGGLFAFLLGLVEPAWTDLKNWWHDNAYEDGKFTITGLLDGIKDKMKDIWNWIKENIFQPFINGFKKAFGIASPSKVMYEQGGFIMEGMFNAITDWISKIIPKFVELKDKIVQKIRDIKSDSTKPLEDIKNNFVETFENMKKGIENAVNGIIGIVENMINKCIEGLNKLGDAPRSALGGVASLADSLGAHGVANKISSIKIPTISKVRIPRLATGTVIPRQASEFIAMLGDNNKESEVVSPLSTIKQAMQEVLNQSGNSSNRVIHITATLDKRVIFEEMIDEGRTQAVINGNNPFDIGYVGV